MRVMVTGAAGFIGSRVVAMLIGQGHDVVRFDTHHGLDVQSTKDVFDQMNGCSVVIHLAGVLGTAELFDDPHKAVSVNVNGALNVLMAAKSNDAHYVSITMPDVWDNVYQATKQCARGLASAWHRHYGVPVSHVRAFNAYGWGQKVHGVQKIVPTFATRAWRDKPIPIWGDGTQTVDLVHVDDIARMLIDATNFGDDQVFDAGTGVAVTVNEVAQTVIDITGSKAGIEYRPMRPGEHETKIVATGEGWDLLGWQPVVRPATFESTVDWYREPRR